MTPGARIAAAIAALDPIFEGAPAEQVLTRWARGARYAGSGDRATVRDHVFDVLRRYRSTAALGGGFGGRARMIGLLRDAGEDPATLFTGQRHAPAPLTADERVIPSLPEDPLVWLDCPGWLAPELRRGLGAEFEGVMSVLRSRAPTFLRVNLRKGDIATAAEALQQDGIEVRPHPLSPTALEVSANSRRVARSHAYATGLVELQDAASQAVTDMLPLRDGDRVLDFCAGGGGKTLAMAGRVAGRFCVHDADPRRMKDLPSRARRAGVPVTESREGVFDLVLADAPCSGTGAWRRSPYSKMSFNKKYLKNLLQKQDKVLAEASAHIGRTGTLAYATCSLLALENADRVARFLDRNRGWELQYEAGFSPLQGGDGFYVALLQRRG